MTLIAKYDAAAVARIEPAGDQRRNTHRETCRNRRVKRLRTAGRAHRHGLADEVNGANVRRAIGHAMQNLQRHQQRQGPDRNPSPPSAQQTPLHPPPARQPRRTCEPASPTRQTARLRQTRRWPKAPRSNRRSIPAFARSAFRMSGTSRAPPARHPTPTKTPRTPVAAAASTALQLSTTARGLVHRRVGASASRGSRWAANDRQHAANATSQMPAPLPQCEIAKPPAKLAATNVSEPHSRMRP